nr:glycosyltransferase [Nitratireductor aquibiodomus]
MPRSQLICVEKSGIAAASGEIVAFIDDDAVPEPEWLTELVSSYDDPSVGAAGGFVYDNTGTRFQTTYMTVNRLGYPTVWDRACPEYNFPFSSELPHLLGTNSSFLREALLAIGGFDEEYEYFLDETDVLCRLVDQGFRIVQRDDAFVHHKFASSALRDHKSIVRNWYPLIKNRVYFALRNGTAHYDFRDCIKAGLDDARAWEQGVHGGVQEGLYTTDEVEHFHSQASNALSDGIARAKLPRKLLTLLPDGVEQPTFLPFPAIRRKDRMSIAFISQDFPPGQNGGIARYIDQLAKTLGNDGHDIFVITKSSDFHRVDYQDDIWVHRLFPKHYEVPVSSGDLAIPQHIWNWSKTACEEVKRISGRRNIDVVYAPIWDCEGIAFIEEDGPPLITSLQTTLTHWLNSYPERREDASWMQMFGNPILSLEKRLIEKSWGLHSISQAIANDVASIFGVDYGKRLLVAPIGLDDWGSDTTEAAHSNVKILFVGRLEARKGIDVLLSAAPAVLAAYPNATLDIVGDDSIRAKESTFRELFAASDVPNEIRRRIHFHGRCDEEALRDFYRACDIFVAPSRYESFGLISLEAMMCSKPVVACRTGGMPEVVIDGETGILAEPGEAESLAAALSRLLDNPSLRKQLGAAGRARYEKLFTSEMMAAQLAPLLDRACSRREARDC